MGANKTYQQKGDFVSPTLEVMVTVDPIAMQKRLDSDNGLTFIDPALR